MKDPDFAEALDFIMRMEFDYVEDKLMEKIEADSESSIHFYLKHRHPDYIPKKRIDFSGE